MAWFFQYLQLLRRNDRKISTPEVKCEPTQGLQVLYVLALHRAPSSRGTCESPLWVETNAQLASSLRSSFHHQNIPCYWLSSGRRWMKKTACLPAFPIARSNHVDDAALVTFWFISMSLFFRKVCTVYIPAWWRQQIFVILIFLTIKRGATNYSTALKEKFELECVPARFLRFSWSLALAMEKFTIYTWSRGATCRLHKLLQAAAADLAQRKNVIFLQGNIAKNHLHAMMCRDK